MILRSLLIVATPYLKYVLIYKISTHIYISTHILRVKKESLLHVVDRDSVSESQKTVSLA